jgi:hypothetical protein
MSTTHGLTYAVAEAAALLGISTEALYDAIRKDDFRSSTGRPGEGSPLRYARTKGRVVFPKAAVADFLGLTIAECDAFLATGAVPEVQQSRGPQYAARWANWPRQ